MSQQSYTIDDLAGAAHLAQLNALAAAIVTKNSGATEPAETHAFMWWADTTSGWLKQRNAANNAWIKRAPLGTGAWVDVASAATLNLDADAASSDKLRITGTTATTAITLAEGQVRMLRAAGAWPITHGASLIVQGGASYTCAAGDLVLAIGEAGGVVRLAIWKADGTAVVANTVAGKNLLINPSGAVYQRAVAATADDTYFADRWNMLTQTGTVTPSVLTDPENGYPNGIRITQSQASAQRFGFAQIIEGKNCKHLRGGSAVLVPRIRASAGQAIRYAILGWTGTEDSVTSDVVLDWTSASYTAGGFFLASNVSVLAVGSQTPTANAWTSLAALAGSVGSAFNNLIVMVWTEDTAAQNFTLDFDFVQLESGATATAFERRSIGVELALCQRYYEKSAGTYSGSIFSGYVTSGDVYYAPVKFIVEKRATPTTISLTNVSAVSFPASAGTVSGSDTHGFAEQRTANATARGAFFSTFTAEVEL